MPNFPTVYANYRSTDEHLHASAALLAYAHHDALVEAMRTIHRQLGDQAWLPILHSFNFGLDREYTLDLVHASTGKTKSVNVYDEVLQALRAYHEDLSALPRNNQLLPVDRLTTSFRSSFVLAGAQARLGNLDHAVSCSLAGQAFLGLYFRFSTPAQAAVTRTVKVLLKTTALMGIKQSLELTGAELSPLQRLDTGTAIGVVFSLITIGGDIYELVEADTSLERERLASKLSFDVLTGLIGGASLIAGGLEGVAIGGSIVAAGLGGVIGGVGVIVGGIGIGITGLLDTIAENAQKAERAADQLFAFYTYANGGQKGDPRYTLTQHDGHTFLEPAAGVVFAGLDLSADNLRTTLGSPQIQKTDPFHPSGKYPTGTLPSCDGDPVPLLPALGAVNTGGEVNNVPAGTILVLPNQPSFCTAFNTYTEVCANGIWGKHTPAMNACENLHNSGVWYRLRFEGRAEMGADLGFSQVDTVVSVRLGLSVRQLVVPQLLTSDDRPSGLPSARIVYDLQGASGVDYAVSTVGNGTLRLHGGAQWLVHVGNRPLDHALSLKDANGAAYIYVGGVEIYLVPGETVVLRDDQGRTKRIELTDPLSLGDVQHSGPQGNSPDLLKKLKGSNVQPKPGTVETVRGYPIANAPSGIAAFWDGKTLLYTSSADPAGTTARSTATWIGRDADGFWCYDADSRSVWHTHSATLEADKQLSFFALNGRSEVMGATVRRGVLVVKVKHETDIGSVNATYVAHGTSLLLTYVEGPTRYLPVPADPKELVSWLQYVGKANHLSPFPGATVIKAEAANAMLLYGKPWEAARFVTTNGVFPLDRLPDDVSIVGFLDHGEGVLYSPSKKTIWRQAPGTQTREVWRDDISMLLTEGGALFGVTDDGLLVSMEPNGTVVLRGVTRTWVKQNKSWWTKLRALAGTQLSSERLAIYHLTAKQEGLPPAQAWYLPNSGGLLFRPQVPWGHLTLQGLDGQGAWFAGDGRVWYQPAIPAEQLATVLPANGTTIQPQHIPAARPGPFIRDETFASCSVTTGGLAVETQSGLHLLFSLNEQDVVELRLHAIRGNAWEEFIPDAEVPSYSQHLASYTNDGMFWGYPIGDTLTIVTAKSGVPQGVWLKETGTYVHWGQMKYALVGLHQGRLWVRDEADGTMRWTEASGAVARIDRDSSTRLRDHHRVGETIVGWISQTGNPSSQELVFPVFTDSPRAGLFMQPGMVEPLPAPADGSVLLLDLPRTGGGHLGLNGVAGDHSVALDGPDAVLWNSGSNTATVLLQGATAGSDRTVEWVGVRFPDALIRARGGLAADTVLPLPGVIRKGMYQGREVVSSKPMTLDRTSGPILATVPASAGARYWPVSTLPAVFDADGKSGALVGAWRTVSSRIFELGLAKDELAFWTYQGLDHEGVVSIPLKSTTLIDTKDFRVSGQRLAEAYRLGRRLDPGVPVNLLSMDVASAAMWFYGQLFLRTDWAAQSRPPLPETVWAFDLGLGAKSGGSIELAEVRPMLVVPPDGSRLQPIRRPELATQMRKTYPKSGSTPWELQGVAASVWGQLTGDCLALPTDWTDHPLVFGG